ncbi:MAG: hypothetical protein SGILL_005204 [Bacillariaceae sp.]
MLELSLCEEVVEATLSFFSYVEQRMSELRVKDGRMKSTMLQMQELMAELHYCNVQSIEKLARSEDRPPPSRKMKNQAEIKAQVRKELKEAAAAKSDDQCTPPTSTAVQADARGGLMAAIQGRGPGPSGERGGLMDALKAHGGRGPAAGGARGGLMAAIAARGQVN